MLYSQWRNLPLSTRQTIAANFGITKKVSIEVFNNEIKSDGFIFEEVEAALTVPAIQRFLDSGEVDMPILWEQLVARIEGREPIIPTITTEAIAAVTEDPVIHTVSTEAPVAAKVDAPAPTKSAKKAKKK